MQRSPLLKISTITMAIGSCFTLIASLFIILITQSDYTTVDRFGGVRVIDAPFFVRLGIIGFDLFAFIFGLISAIQTQRGKGFKVSILGAASVLVAGLLFFVGSFVNVFLPNLTDFPFFSWWWLLQGFFGFPIVFVASLALIYIVLEKRGIQSSRKSNLLLISGGLMVLCSIEAVFFGFMSYSPSWTYSYQIALNDRGFLAAIYSWVLSACTFVFSIGAGILLLLRRCTRLAIALTLLVLFSGLLLSMTFTSTIYYRLVWAWLGGPLFEIPTIVLSSSALVLAIYSLRQKHQENLSAQ